MKPYVGSDVAERVKAMGEHYGMSGNQLCALILTEYSRVRKEHLFHALGSISEDLKARPVGRPAGSRVPAKPAKRVEQALAVAGSHR